MPHLDFSVKLGTNIQSFSGKAWNNDFKPGIVGGVAVGFHKNKIGVRAEVLISNANYKSTVLVIDSGGTEKVTVKAIYLSIPLMLEYQVLPVLKIQAGPQYSNLMSANGNSFEAGDPKALFKISEFSAVAGLEVKLPKNILVGARYIAGITDLNRKELPLYQSDAWKNTTIQVYLGYSFQ